MRTFLSRSGLCAVLAVIVVGVMGVSASSALAAMPWWHVNTVSAPAGKAGDEAQVLFEIGDLGDAPVKAYEHPVSIVAKLPAGVTPTAVYAEVGSEFYSSVHDIDKAFTQCAILEQTVTCSFQGGLLEYERVMLAVYVKVTPGAGAGVSVLSVSGGGAPAVLSRHALALEGVPGEGLADYELLPEEEGGGPDTQAGSHPFQLTTAFTVNTKTETVPREGAGSASKTLELQPEIQPVGITKDLRFQIPPGLIGNPEPVPRCNVYTFLRSGEESGGAETACPTDTQVGVAAPVVTTISNGSRTPWAFTKPLYNLEPAVGEPARFGFRLIGGGTVILDTSVRTGGDYGVVVSVPDVPETLEFIGSQVTFWGDPSDPRHADAMRPCFGSEETLLGGTCPAVVPGQPFLIMPTSCTGPLHSTMEADSWNQPGRFSTKEYTFQNLAGEPYGLDGCNHLNFEPSISVAPDGQQASTPTGLTVDVHVPQNASLNPVGLTESNVKDTTVALPAGVGLNPAGADGLQACGLGEIALESAAEQTCPEASKVGTVEISTPLLPNPLVGAAYLATQNANPFGSLVALYIVARDPVSGVLVKLAGEVQPNPETGQLVSTFKETPQLPFEDLKLHFFGGSRAPLGTPALCGSYTTTASIAPWSGNEPVDSSSEFKITSGPNGAPCSDPLPFHPTLQAGSTNIQTGGYTQLTTTMGREDGEQNLQAIQLHFPEGLIGSLSQVQLCGEPQADQGTCPPASQIGETTVSVGLGGNPYTVNGGQVFITGPYDGAPFGLSIVNPAKAGPFDLGKVVVRAKVEVNPITSALTVTTDPSGPYAIPHILDGIPLEIKHVNVLINRQKFVFNPSNCTPTAITATLSSGEGASSNVSTPFQVTNCATLKFKPKFAVATPGKTSRTNGTSLAVKLTYPVEEGQANIAKVKVELPKQLPARLPTLQKACTEAEFDANPESCPATSKVGEAVATTPTISGMFTGPAYFVSRGGAAWPELIVVLKGEDGVTVDLHGETHISKQGVTSSTFNTVPDVPVGSFELKLPAGPYSALTANGANLCAKTLAMPTEFIAQNGAVIRQNTSVATTGCPKHRKTVKKKHKARANHKRKTKR